MKVDTSRFGCSPLLREERAIARQDAAQRSLEFGGMDRKKIFAAMRTYLINCIQDEALRTTQSDLMACFKCPDQGQEIWVGHRYDPAKNFDRSRSRPHIVRADGAWFDFAFRLDETSDGAFVLGYNAEIRFDCSPSDPQASWMRFDLSPPDHSNDAERHMRAHMHAGSDDWLVPSPMYTPFELLDLLVFGLARSSDRKPRAP